MKIFCDKKPDRASDCLFSTYDYYWNCFMCKLQCDGDVACNLEDGIECDILEVLEPKVNVHLDQVDIYGKVMRGEMPLSPLLDKSRN